MFVRIRFIAGSLHGMPLVDSYVKEDLLFSTVDGEYLKYLAANGFRKVNQGDPEECIMPGAILSVTPCNEKGYSKWDLVRTSGRMSRNLEVLP